MIINNPDNLPMEYIEAEIKQFESEKKRKVVEATFRRIDNEHCEQEFTCEPIEFERIRRITGYLVGSTKRWNNAKKAELNDRVTHGGAKNA